RTRAERVRAAPALATGARSTTCGTARSIPAASREWTRTRGNRRRDRRRTRDRQVAVALCVREAAREVGRMSSNEKFEREFADFLAEEDSRLASLYRKLPQLEPDSRLDGAVRAMAYRALNPQLVATPQAGSQSRRGRWLPALGAA